MAFPFFTKRSRLPSPRLNLVAGYFQLSGLLTGTVVVGIVIAKFFDKEGNYILPLPLPLLVLYVALSAISFYQIGRGLLLRQRWAGYLAAFTFGAPVVKKFITAGTGISIGSTIYPLPALIAVASVWPELGSVRDSEFAANDEGDGVAFPKRNRGFGQQRDVSPEPTPNLSTPESTHTSNLKVVREHEKEASEHIRS